MLDVVRIVGHFHIRQIIEAYFASLRMPGRVVPKRGGLKLKESNRFRSRFFPLFDCFGRVNRRVVHLDGPLPFVVSGHNAARIEFDLFHSFLKDRLPIGKMSNGFSKAESVWIDLGVVDLR